jgi:hypothetical protein
VDRCRSLSNVWNGEEGYVLQGTWLVLHKSAKDRFFRVDPLEQLVPPCVRYKMTCLLIRNAIRSVSYSVAWERVQCLASIGKIVAKHDILL